MMSDELAIHIRTQKDISDWRIGQKILEPLFQIDRLRPEFAAVSPEVKVESCNHISKISDCETLWGEKFTLEYGSVSTQMFNKFSWLKRKNIRSSGMITFTDKSRSGDVLPGGINFYSKYHKDIDWFSLFKSWCLVLEADEGIFNPFQKLDVQPLIERRKPDQTTIEEVETISWGRYTSGILECSIQAGELNSKFSGLTNLGWATFFGKRISHLVDQKHLTATGYDIDDIGDGVLLRVTNSLSETIHDYPKFVGNRRALKKFFPETVFLIQSV
jgi:hypothetical protein